MSKNPAFSAEFYVSVLFYNFRWVLDYNPDKFCSQTSCGSPLHPDPPLRDTAGGVPGFHDERNIHHGENNVVLRTLSFGRSSLKPVTQKALVLQLGQDQLFRLATPKGNHCGLVNRLQICHLELCSKIITGPLWQGCYSTHA